jgi:formylglycine-generating enzyme required for sulfatase activity
MGTVYQAYDTHRQHDVALKLLPQALLHETGFRERFENEARTIISLEHYAIVPVYDFGAIDDQPYIAMRLMGGGSLADRLKNGAVSVSDSAEIMRRICSALDRAHGQNIVHRDLKPGNILFDEENKAYLADFGIARMTEGTQTVTIIGTPQYMAPEQATGEPLDARTDVYQMGVVLFHMLTGAAPFNATTPASLMYKHVYEPVPALHLDDSELSASIQAVVEMAMAKNREDRFQSTGALATAFAAATQNNATFILPPPIPPAQVKSRLRPALIGMGLVLVLLGVSGGVWAFGRTTTASPSPTATARSTRPVSTVTTAITAEPTGTISATETQLPTNTPTPGPTATPAPTLEPRAAANAQMIQIPAVAFTMGLDKYVARDLCAGIRGSQCSTDFFRDEDPEHRVTLDNFLIDPYEVTNAAYANCVADSSCSPPTESGSALRASYYGNPEFADFPVLFVTHRAAIAFCEWRGVRLPTEAEWELAARGTNELYFPWGNSFEGNFANFCDANCREDHRATRYNDGHADTAPVGSYPRARSPYGVYDMAGNVWEWTADWYDHDYYEVSPDANPTGPTTGSERVIRGGSWYNTGSFLHSALREYVEPNAARDNLGFRCAATP